MPFPLIHTVPLMGAHVSVMLTASMPEARQRRSVFPPEHEKPMTDSLDSYTDPKLLTIQLPLWKWQEYVTGPESIRPRQATV